MDSFIGRLGIGRIRSGTLKKNTPIALSQGPGTEPRQVKVSELFNFDAMGRAPIDKAEAGEIVVFSGVQDFTIGDTLVDPDDPMSLEPIEVEQPTMSITFGVNKSPFAGRVGKLLTSRNIRHRLSKERLVTIEYEVPSRGMNGVKSKLLSASRGLAVMSSTFAGYKSYAGDFGERDRGNLLSFETGTTSAFSLAKIQERGALFSSPGEEVYENQIIGINAKALTNMRSAGADEKSNVTPPMQLTLEDAVEYIQEGEFVEVTPDAVRMGKKPKPSRF